MVASVIEKQNPFHQVKQPWQVTCVVPQHVVAAVECAFEDVILSISSFELDEEKALWRVMMVWGEKLSDEDVTIRLDRVCGAFDVVIAAPAMQVVEDRDWVAEVQASFPPLEVGSFIVLGSHHGDVSPPLDKVVLQLDAGAAFGTGEHATTSGCLIAIDWVMKKYGRGTLRRALDMGCGSGILAMGLAKRYRVPVLAIDIDARSVEVANENFENNQLTKLVKAHHADGYKSRLLRETGEFELIVANILARPLVSFAPDLAKQLTPKGVVILSGLLNRQEQMVLEAHRKQGLRLIRRVQIDGWSTLVLAR